MSIIDSLNRPWQVINLATGGTITVQACNAEAAVLAAVIEWEPNASAYLDANPLHVGERSTAIGDYCTLTRSPRLEDIFNV